MVSVGFTEAELPEAGDATNGHLLAASSASPLPAMSSSTIRPAPTLRPSAGSIHAPDSRPSTKSGGVPYVIQPVSGHGR